MEQWIEPITKLIETGGTTAIWAIVIIQGVSLLKVVLGWMFAFLGVRAIARSLVHVGDHIGRCSDD